MSAEREAFNDDTGSPYDPDWQDIVEGFADGRGGVTAPRDDAFWDARPELRAIEQYAHRLILGPWALFGVCAARALLNIPYRVTYSSVLGNASLNAATIIVAPTGLGKGRIARLADNAVHFQRGPFMKTPRRFESVEIGSGEAMAEVFATANKDGTLNWKTEAREVLFGFAEVGRLTKIGNGDTATIYEYAKQAISGEQLGRILVRNRGILLPGDSYRMGMLIYGQPKRMGPLLTPDEIAGGFPGRLAWFDGVNPSAGDDHRSAMRARDLPPVVVEAFPDDVTEIRALPEMDAWHREAVFAGHMGEIDDIAAQEGMTRSRCAMALMALGGRHELNHGDWELSEHVMDHIHNTRAACLIASSTLAIVEAENIGRQRARIRDGQVREEARDLERKIVQLVIAHTDNSRHPGKACTRGECLRKLKYQNRRITAEELDIGLDAAQHHGRLTTTEVRPDTGTTGGRPRQDIDLGPHARDPRRRDSDPLPGKHD